MSDYILKSKSKKKRVKGTKGVRREYKKSVSKKLDSRTNRLEKTKTKYAKSKTGGLISGPGSKTKSKKVTAKRAAKLIKRAQNKPLKRKLSTVGQRIKRGVRKVARKVARKVSRK